MSFLSSGGVDNLPFSVSGLLSFSASWYRALLFPYLLTHLVIYDACFQDLTETHIEWLPIVRLSWLPFRWREQEVILNSLGCRLSCKNKSIKRKSCFEEQTPFCGLLLVSILNSCLEYRLNEVSCAYLHFLSVLPTSCVKHFFSTKSSQTKTKRATIVFFLFPLLLLSSSFLFPFLLSFSLTSRFSSLLSAKIPPFGPFSPKWL